uniref:Uncharacterized protein n=1 Tax=Hemiselmis andersenii TaxID=464988 RepID=A0A6U4Y130_HEMAN|mmetsp:Transcript_37463/g.91047  ORF Transcript_37463/g.91047 Transcript_37463/m.91047 type:complete len:315 (+) Transcript_37463:1279-2223(+)
MSFWWKSNTGFNLALKKICEKKLLFPDFFQIFTRGLKAFFIFRNIFYHKKIVFNFPVYLLKFFLKVFSTFNSNNLPLKTGGTHFKLNRILDFILKTDFKKNFENPIENVFKSGKIKKNFTENFSCFLFFNSKIFLKSKKTEKIKFNNVLIRLRNFKKKGIYPNLIFFFLEKMFQSSSKIFNFKIDLLFFSKKYIFRIFKPRFFMKEIVFLKLFKHFFFWLDNKWNQKRLFAFSILEKFLIQEWKKKKIWLKKKKKFYCKIKSNKLLFSLKNTRLFRNFQKSPSSKRCEKICIEKLALLLRDFFFFNSKKISKLF